jgi:cytochrome P450
MTSVDETSAATKVEAAVPDHVPPEMVRQFDFHEDPAFMTGRPFEALDAVRGERIFWSTDNGGHWVLTEAADIRAVYQAPDTFSSHPVGIPGGQGWPRKLIPEELDPPEHGKYRQILALPFSPGSIKFMSDGVRQTCVNLVEPLVDRGSCEFLDDFARPYPTTIFTGILGIPVAESAKFLKWNHDLLHSHNPDTQVAAGGNIAGYLGQLIEERTARPTDDLTSLLIGSKVDGRPMTKEEVLDTAFLMFMAGLDTVTAALSFIFNYLATHDDARRRLVDDPDLIPPAIEELLRFHAFVNPGRYLTKDIEFAGVQMKKGDAVLVSTPLSTRDPAEFADPTTVDFERSPNHHIAFGAGPHRCVGSHLARRELEVALREWLQRIPDFHLAEGAVITSHGGGVMGLERLPLVWP